MSRSDNGELEVTCRKCNGSGCVRDGGERCACPLCEGAGFEPTELGERVLALVRHNFRPMFERMQDRDDL